MCEDRALRMRKGCSARTLRLSQLRFRARLLQRFQQAVPALPDSDSSNDSDQLQVNSPAPAPTTESRSFALDRVTRLPFSGDVCVKAQPSSVRARNEGLIDIALRTVSLMRRNQQLQRKLAILKAETQEFIKSVMNNPENKVNFSATTATVTECSPSNSEASTSSSEQRMEADDSSKDSQ